LVPKSKGAYLEVIFKELIIRCVIQALESLSRNIIIEEKVGCEDPYWYNYYLFSESN